MENYREKVKIQNIILAFGCIILSVFCTIGCLAEAGIVNLTPVAGDSHWQSQWRGFVSGASLGILALLLFGLIRNLLALRDEKKLKKLYIKESDERQTQIYTQAMCAAMRTTLILGLVAVVVSGYFNMTVSLTLLAAVFFVSLVAIAFMLYFLKKY